MKQEGRKEDLTDRRKPVGTTPKKGKKVRIHREGGYDSRFPERQGKRKKQKKYALYIKWAAAIACVIAAAAFAGAAFWVFSLFGKLQKEPQIQMEDFTNPNIDTSTQQVMRENWTIAVFGVDSRDGSLGKGTNADVIMLCNINEKTGDVRVVSIYRDTCMKVGEKNPYKKINEAYARGGIGQAVEALNENLDIEIDDYVAVNWKAVADTVNLLGGIDIELTKEEFRYINGYITSTVEGTGVGSHQLKQAGLNHLDGVQTVAYARLRYMDSDFQRTERQREVLSKILEKAKKAELPVLSQILAGVLPQTKTSLEAADLLPAIQTLSKFHMEAASGFPFQLEAKRIVENGRGIDYVFPVDLADNVSQLHKFLYGTENYQVSDKVRQISQAIEEKSRQTAPKKTTSAAKTTEAERENMESRESLEESFLEEEELLPTTEGFSPTSEELFTSQGEPSEETEELPAETEPPSSLENPSEEETIETETIETETIETAFPSLEESLPERLERENSYIILGPANR